MRRSQKTAAGIDARLITCKDKFRSESVRLAFKLLFSDDLFSYFLASVFGLGRNVLVEAPIQARVSVVQLMSNTDTLVLGDRERHSI